MPEPSGDVAIVTDQWTEVGGAERVALAMADTFNAPIYAGRVDDDVVPDGQEVVEAFDRAWVRLALRGPYILQDAVQMLAWQHVPELYQYDTVILNKNNPGWFVPRDDQTVVKYCHTTPREAYDLFHNHGRGIMSRILKTAQRVLYQPNLAYPDKWLANSELVARRLELYWDQSDVDVIYPPVPVTDYDTAADTGDYYFTISRLYGHKHVDTIVRAFNRLNQQANTPYQLKIAGEGPHRDHLEDLASDHIEFLGHVSDERKRTLYARAKATVFAAENEDFGLVPIESYAAGTPVIGVQDGYTKHQILNGKTGLTYTRSPTRLEETIRYFEKHGVSWTAADIRGFATQFDVNRFKSDLQDAVAAAEQSARVTPAWDTPEHLTTAPPDDASAEIDPAVTDGGPP